jgi:3-oxoadipate enol-lactonase
VGGMSGLVGFQIERWFSSAFRANHPDVVENMTAKFIDNDFDCYASSCALLGDADLRQYLPKIAVPVSVVVGEDDAATPVAMARELHEAIPNSTLTIIPEARHLTPIERPDLISDAIRGLPRTS